MTHIRRLPAPLRSAGAGERSAPCALKLFVAGHSHILRVVTTTRCTTCCVNPRRRRCFGIHKLRTAVRYFTVDGDAAACLWRSAVAPQIGRACPAAVLPLLREAAFPGGASPLVAPGSCDSADGPCLAPNDRYFPADALSSVAGAAASRSSSWVAVVLRPASRSSSWVAAVFPASVPFRCASPMPDRGVAVHFFFSKPWPDPPRRSGRKWSKLT